MVVDMHQMIRLPRQGYNARTAVTMAFSSDKGDLNLSHVSPPIPRALNFESKCVDSLSYYVNKCYTEKLVCQNNKSKKHMGKVGFVVIAHEKRETSGYIFLPTSELRMKCCITRMHESGSHSADIFKEMI